MTNWLALNYNRLPAPCSFRRSGGSTSQHPYYKSLFARASQISPSGSKPTSGSECAVNSFLSRIFHCQLNMPVIRLAIL